MKRLTILAVLALALLPGAVFAQGRSGDNRPDSPPGLDNRPDTPASDNRPASPPGQSSSPSGQGSSPPGLENRPSDWPGNAFGTRTKGDRALEAVQNGQAVPLSRVLGKARSATGGDLIDARLMTVDGFLLYELRMLLPDGTVDHMYYYASTGNPVTTN